MTPKQRERIENKIKKIKAALRADKKALGGAHRDGQGLRYMPPRFYLKLQDYSGGLRYMNWFHKNFPDDACYPDFLFEWTVILFKNKKLKQAEIKAFETYCRNTYLIDTFLGHKITQFHGSDCSNLASYAFAQEYFTYKCDQPELADFTAWLTNLFATPKFKELCEAYFEIQKQLAGERKYKARVLLLRKAERLMDFIR